MDTTRMNLMLMNAEQLAHRNHHVLVMQYQHNKIGIQIDVMFMETFRRQILFLNGIFSKEHILYRQNPAMVITVIVGSEKVSELFQLL